MGKSVQVISVILVSTFIQLISSQLVLSHELPEENANPYGPRRETRVNNGNGNFTCTTEGRFPNPENCSEYYLCVLISPGNLYLSKMTCPNALVFNPNAQKCTTTGNYSCTATTTATPTTAPTVPPTLCAAPGFICHTATSYTLCADVNVPILTNASCPQGYFCNVKCVAPCIHYLPSC